MTKTCSNCEHSVIIFKREDEKEWICDIDNSLAGEVCNKWLERTRISLYAIGYMKG